MDTTNQLLNQVIHHVANNEVDQASALFSQVLNAKSISVLRGQTNELPPLEDNDS